MERKSSNAKSRKLGLIRVFVAVCILFMMFSALTTVLIEKGSVSVDSLNIVVKIILFLAAFLGMTMSLEQGTALPYFLLEGTILVLLLFFLAVVVIDGEESNFTMPIIVFSAAISSFLLKKGKKKARPVSHRRNKNR